MLMIGDEGRNSHSDWYSNGGTSVPMWGKTNGLSATLLWDLTRFDGRGRPSSTTRALSRRSRIRCRQQFVSGLEQDNSHADAHGYGFGAGGCS
jgi:hypothetical protein